ncbi:hypothetical protein ACXZ1K_19400 [Pedobacter sp. PWIIR3]
MFTEPTIVSTGELDKRSYVSFYFNGQRFRKSNGNRLNLKIHPNHSKTISARDKLLNKLHFEFKKALSAGWSPFVINTKEVKLIDALSEVLNEKLSSSYSPTYKRDLKKLYDQFLSFIPKHILNDYAYNLEISKVEGFLSQFKSSSRHYMNKRRTLSVFFSEMVRKEYLSNNVILKTGSQKCKSTLHDIYPHDQLHSILEFLKLKYPNLHLCCLLTYGCFLRPHEEVRLLTRSHLNDDFTQIQLSGKENKSGRIRNVYVPLYVQTALHARLGNIAAPYANIFTLENEVEFNSDYFKTQSSRAKSEMIKLGIIN